jgi:PQQ-like domain
VTERGETAGAGTLARRLPTPGEYPCGLTWDGAHLWHSDQAAARVYAIDPTVGSVVRTHYCGWVRADMSYDGSLLCQIGGRPKRLVLIEPDTGRLAGFRPILPANGRVTGAEIGPEGLWLVLRSPNVVQLRDYPSLEIRREHAVPGASPSGLAYVDGMVVYGDFESGTLHVVDAATGECVRSIALDAHPTGMTWDGRRLWYCDFRARALRAFDLATAT